jgi:hypothetical protein
VILGGALTSSSCGGGNGANGVVSSSFEVRINKSFSSKRFNLSESFDSSAVRFSNVFKPLVPLSCCKRFLIFPPWDAVPQLGCSAGIEALREDGVPELDAVLAAVSRAVSRPLSVDRLAALLRCDPLRTSSSLGGLSIIVYLDPSTSWAGDAVLLDDFWTEILLTSLFDPPVTLPPAKLELSAVCSVSRAFRIKVDGRSSSDELFLPLLECAKFLSVRVCHPPVDMDM